MTLHSTQFKAGKQVPSGKELSYPEAEKRSNQAEQRIQYIHKMLKIHKMWTVISTKNHFKFFAKWLQIKTVVYVQDWGTEPDEQCHPVQTYAEISPTDFNGIHFQVSVHRIAPQNIWPVPFMTIKRQYSCHGLIPPFNQKNPKQMSDCYILPSIKEEFYILVILSIERFNILFQLYKMSKLVQLMDGKRHPTLDYQH